MLASALLLASTIALPALASPVSLVSREFASYRDDIQIHESCNATQRRQLTKAVSDTMEVAQLVQNYIVANGPTDPVFELYFGNDPSAYTAALGVYEGILKSNKEGVLLRCDDIDGNCPQEGWAGHWRGENATSETVICDLSYESRKFNEQWCALGYTVAASAPAYYWATDLIHRLLHVPVISNSAVTHFEGADTYTQCLDFAKSDSAKAPYNSHTLQYFAAHVYGSEVGAPGVGCVGEPSAEETSAHSAATTSVSAAAASNTVASATASAGKSCHTHAGGELHCV